MSDSWIEEYFAGEMAPTDNRGTPSNWRDRTDVADPLLVVGTVLELLAARGVPVVLDHSLERCAEAAAVLLRHLGVETIVAEVGW